MTEEVSGAQLKAMRLAAGLDVAVLARRVSLSTAQLQQLENDQHSLFYTPAIRRHAARKVLAHLNSQWAPGESDEVLVLPAQPVLPDPVGLLQPRDGQVPISTSRITLGDLPIQDLSEQLEPTAGLGSAQPQASAGANASGRSTSLDRAAGRSGRHIGLGWAALFVLAALLSGWLILKRPFFNPVNPASDGPWAAQTAGMVESSAVPKVDGPNKSTAPESASRPQAQENLERDLVALAPTGGLQASPGTAAPTQPARPGDTPACPERLDSAPAIALKSAPGQGSLIYLLSNVAQVVCVLDGSGKVKSHRLEPGQVKGVAGPPPWTLQASAMQTVQVYFQGSRVRLPPEAQDRVRLVGPD